MTERLFKALGLDGTPCHGGKGRWSLPTDDGPGEWMPPIEGALVACKNGYHACTQDQIAGWLGPALFELEYRGERVDCGDKIVVREARLPRKLDAWNERVARLFACDCAERVLPLFEREYPNDIQPRTAIDVARRFANGDATKEQMATAYAATSDAAWTKAWVAAHAAAWAAAYTAAYAVAYATAWIAACATARDAALAASHVTASATERAWQTKQLMEYLDGRCA